MTLAERRSGVPDTCFGRVRSRPVVAVLQSAHPKSSPRWHRARLFDLRDGREMLTVELAAPHGSFYWAGHHPRLGRIAGRDALATLAGNVVSHSSNDC